MPPLDYRSAGVDYGPLDQFKRACQLAAAGTASNLVRHGLTEAPGTRGESAYVMEAPDACYAHVEEALGTKILVADEMYRRTGRSFYQEVALDDVATIANDLCSVGALPTSIAMYVAVGDNDYLADAVRARDLARGFAEGCRLCGATWGGGETQTLKGMVAPGTAVLGGSAWGRIAPKSNWIRGAVREGDAIVFLASSGVQTNGLTLCRALAEKLPQGYLTPVPGAAEGTTYGEALLAPSVIYVRFIAACQQAGIPLHYTAHLTGHGWRKLMRLEEPFVYRVDFVPLPPPVFDLITRTAGLSVRDAYATFNMGVGFAVFVAPQDESHCLEVAQVNGYIAWHGGTVWRDGTRKAVIVPSLGLLYEADSLKIR